MQTKEAKPTNAQWRCLYHDFYLWGIGSDNAAWYINYLKQSSFTKRQASEEISPLDELKQKRQFSLLKRKNWEDIKPDEETLRKFLEERERRRNGVNK